MQQGVPVHLVDGTYELFRSHFGAPPATAPDGQQVGAVRGVLASLCSLLRDPTVRHVAVAFDTTVESFRNELFSGYKTGEGLDPDLFAQFPIVERAVRALGLVVWSMVEFEADDALAAGAERFGNEPFVGRVVLCTPDKDLAQCVDGERIVQWDRRRDVVFDEAAVREKHGVAPASIPDLLALVGDPQDGIPGVPRFGSKSAALLLAHYGSIEAIPDDEAAWAVRPRGAAALAESLRRHHAEATLYKRLATLRRDVPLAETLADLRWRGPRPELPQVLAGLGYERLLERVPAV
jgi:5'-3' exonuclease